MARNTVKVVPDKYKVLLDERNVLSKDVSWPTIAGTIGCAIGLSGLTPTLVVRASSVIYGGCGVDLVGVFTDN